MVGGGAWASTAGGREAMASWIFIHGTNTSAVDRGLIVLVFDIFVSLPPSQEIFLPTPLRRG